MKENYNAWDIKLSDFPVKGSIDDKIRFFTRFGILAANIHNTQPWLFAVRKNVLLISPNVQYQLTAGDPSGNNMYITIGCCVANIECVAAYFGFEVFVKVREDKGQQFKVELSFLPVKKVNEELSALAVYITKRYSNKRAYLSKPLSKSSLAKLKSLMLEGLTLALVDDKVKISSIAKLQEQAVKDVASRDFTTELSYWVTGNNTSRQDGMPGFVEGFPPLKAIVGKYLLRFYPKIIVNTLAKKNRIILSEGPLVGVIASKDINRKVAVAVGRLYQRVALCAFSLNVHCTPMHAIIEVESGQAGLRDIVKLGDLTPRFMFRMGYADNQSYHTPRRSIEKFYV